MRNNSYLLDSCFIIALERELAERRVKTGPAHRLLASIAGRKISLYVSIVTIAEVFEGWPDDSKAAAFYAKWPVIGMSRHVAEKCAINQRRARIRGSRMGENDAWQAAIAMAIGSGIITKDGDFAHAPAGLEVVDFRKFARPEKFRV